MVCPREQRKIVRPFLPGNIITIPAFFLNYEWLTLALRKFVVSEITSTQKGQLAAKILDDL
jgi:hypothetical protein